MEFGTLVCRFAQIKQVFIVQDQLISDIFENKIRATNFIANVFPSVSQGEEATTSLYGPFPYQNWEFLIYPFHLHDPDNPDSRARAKNLFLACMGFKKKDAWYLTAYDNKSKLERVLNMWFKSLLDYVQLPLEGVSTTNAIVSHPLTPYIKPFVETIKKTTELQYMISPDFYAIVLMARMFFTAQETSAKTEETQKQLTILRDRLFQVKNKEEYLARVHEFLNHLESLFKDTPMFKNVHRWMDIISYIFSQTSDFNPEDYRDSFDYADFIASTNPFPLEEMLLGYMKEDLK
ncbi:MAG: hypothetical protein ACXAEU_25395 [Candidatus Hodarchaeales archaeon]|jgi:hypothetical protein